VDAYSGAQIRTFDISGAQGVTRFSAQYVKSGYDLSASRVYAGDLNGNVWRVDLASGAIVKALAGAGQPFTTAPTLTVCNGKTIVYIGSGKFVEASDATDKAQQSFYGFVDNYDSVGTLTSPRTALQQLGISGSTISPTSSSGSDKGWYIDLPDIPSAGGAERVALVDPKLEGNILTFATNIPESGVCLASGRSKIYQQPLRTCSVSDAFPAMLTGEVRDLGNSLVVGITTIKLPDGTIKIITTGSDGGLNTIQSGQSAGSPPFSGRRMNWRELLRN
jgi:type IV pilus assembly protein PilY1